MAKANKNNDSNPRSGYFAKFWKDNHMRWQFGAPPKGNANFGCIQHFIDHLAPHSMAGFVLAYGSISSNESREATSAGLSSRPTSWTAWSPFPADSLLL